MKSVPILGEGDHGMGFFVLALPRRRNHSEPHEAVMMPLLYRRRGLFPNDRDRPFFYVQKENAMNHQLTVQYALMCLRELEEHGHEAVSSKEISDKQGVPLPECEDILERLADSGIVRPSDHE